VDGTPDRSGGIVVGVDGSACAREALAWAGRLAGRAGLRLTAVRAWCLTSAPRPPTWEPAYVPPLADYELAVEAALAADVAAAGVPEGVTVRCRAVHRAPVDALVDASADADMLVIGSRGRGGVRGRLLGSVTTSLVEAAGCPVVVVRPGARTDGARRRSRESREDAHGRADHPDAR
jgi:nucleotide-binding universal stress UspA family protein